MIQKKPTKKSVGLNFNQKVNRSQSSHSEIAIKKVAVSGNFRNIFFRKLIFITVGCSVS